MGPQPTTVAIVEVVERLEAIGLEAKDAALYVQLWLRGASKASDIAAAAKLNRTEAYRSLDNLIARGFVTAGLARPTLYVATEPERVFEDALAHHVAKLTHIETSRERALESLRALRGNAFHADVKLGYRIIQGRHGIHATMNGLLRNAKQGQIIVSTQLTPTALEGNSPLDLAAQLARGGLPTKLLLVEKPGTWPAVETLAAHAHIEVRYFDPPTPVRFAIVDDCELLFWLASDASNSPNARGDVAMWTNAPDYVQTQRLFFETLWASARDAGRPKKVGVRVDGL